MFGYIQPDIPHMYVKDGILYKAMYCGLCKSIGKCCGQRARMGLSYDMTFLSAILHNIKNTDVKIEKKHCILHPILKRPIAQDDEITQNVARINTILTYYKLTDDINDEKKGRLTRSVFKSGYLKAKKQMPELDALVYRYMGRLERVEKENCSSIDQAADPFGEMIASLSDLCLEEYRSESTYNLFYGIGKWIYLIDALDDYDKDIKKRNYNPFYAAYGDSNRETMLQKNGEEVQFILKSIYAITAESVKKIRFYFNHDLTDNIVLRGIPTATQRVLCGCKGKGTKPEKMKF